jgi:magnesium-transporting ATPase (P-type)
VVPDAPTSPYTSIIPLLFVILVTAVKQGYEDILRHRADDQLNNMKIRVLKHGKFHHIKWKDVHVRAIRLSDFYD